MQTFLNYGIIILILQQRRCITEDLEQMTADMTNIIAIMDKVCEFDTSKPAYALDAVDYKDLRADEHRNSYPTEEIVKNAKNVKNNSFVVPKVV